MLCTWWGWKRFLYYELLPENQMINSNKYCSQSNQLKAALNENSVLVNRKHIIFHQDNIKLRFFDDQAKTVTACLGSSDSSIVFIKHCNLDLHLFRCLQNSLNGKNFNSLEDCKSYLGTVLCSEI